MNERDSEIMAHLLREAGYPPAGSPEGADIRVVNTCHIRDHASQKALSLLGRLKDWKRKKSGRVMVFAGCVAEAEGRSLLSRFPHADIVLGPARLPELPALVAAALEGAPPVAAVGVRDAQGVPEAPVTPSGVRMGIKITEGCDRGCTYCVVPSVRGRERHRGFGEIVAEACRLAAAGVPEVMLLGQAVNSYGHDSGPDRDFPALLRALSGPGMPRQLRFMSSHPLFAGQRLFEAMRDGANVCAHLHLPVQSGSDIMLRRMARGHTAEKYLGAVELARRTVPGLVVTTDFIVGFPGETDDDFGASLALVRSAGFEGAYTFKYSPRPGTPAAEFPGQLPEEVKEERLAALNALIDSQGRRYNESLVGAEMDVLVEGPDANGTAWQGRLASNRLVFFARGDAVAGQVRRVRITAAATWTLAGELAAARQEVRA
jgi:tRNA-2-methylthio-N6-dimethylallyladenosine synthase